MEEDNWITINFKDGDTYDVFIDLEASAFFRKYYGFAHHDMILRCTYSQTLEEVRHTYEDALKDLEDDLDLLLRASMLKMKLDNWYWVVPNGPYWKNVEV